MKARQGVFLLMFDFGHPNDQEIFETSVIEQILEPDPFIYYES